MARLKKNIVRAASLLVASLLVTSTCCESVRLKDNGNLAAEIYSEWKLHIISPYFCF